MKKITLLILLIFCAMNISAQTQLGNSLPGEDMSNQSGTSIAMNNTGNFIVVGAPRAISAFNGGASIRGGHVRTYAYNGSGWTAGSDFDAEEKGDLMGFSVAVSGDGSIIACGAPDGDPNGTNSGYVHVYLAQGSNPITPNSYIRLGEDLDGEATTDRFGQSIAINDAGTRLIVGAPGGNYVKVFEKQAFADPWTQLGQTLNGDGNNDRFGISVSIDKDGDRIIIGATGNDDNGQDSGRTKVYDLINGNWTQVGSNIDGASGNRAGNSVDISDNGNTIAVGFPGVSTLNINRSGAVRIFTFDGTSWNQKGNDIVGRAFESLGGSGNDVQEGAIDLQAGGDRIVVGSKSYFDQGSTKKGHITLYQFENGVWNQKGSVIGGVGANDEFGTSVVINDSDGTIIAGGAPFADENGKNDSGHTRVYNLSVPLNVEIFDIENAISVFPNPSSNKISIQGFTIKKVDFFDSNGKKVKTASSETIDISNLNSGIYFLKIESDKNKFSYKKLVVN